MDIKNTLLCWHSKRAGVEVLDEALKRLKNRKVSIGKVIVLTQSVDENCLYKEQEFGDIQISFRTVGLENVADHNEIYQAIESEIIPELKLEQHLHVNVSPGTPAMHAVWLILHARGRFPHGTILWSSQYNPDTKRTSIAKVDFSVNTYLAEIAAISSSAGGYALYDLDPKSKARQGALQTLKQFSCVPKAPLLVLGERGTGKTRLIETVVGKVKHKRVVTLACGGLDSQVVDSMLFGHVKGAFTGAEKDRNGLLQEANGKVLFLDEIQDLPTSVQRKLVRVLQDNHHSFRPVGSDTEQTSDFELVCASNKSLEQLATILDADFFDRVSMLTITIPPLRVCREDILSDWQRIWQEVNVNPNLPVAAPVSDELILFFNSAYLSGNLRDLKKLAYMTCAFLSGQNAEMAISSSLASLGEQVIQDEKTAPRFRFGDLTQATKDGLTKEFNRELAKSAKKQFGTWIKAAEALKVDQKTLQKYMREY